MLKLSKTYLWIERLKKNGRGFGLVVRAVGWQAGDPGSILGRDGLFTFGCTPHWALWVTASAEINALYKKYAFKLTKWFFEGISINNQLMFQLNRNICSRAMVLFLLFMHPSKEHSKQALPNCEWETPSCVKRHRLWKVWSNRTLFESSCREINAYSLDCNTFAKCSTDSELLTFFCERFDLYSFILVSLVLTGSQQLLPPTLHESRPQYLIKVIKILLDTVCLQ
jgi:hypothetical protein